MGARARGVVGFASLLGVAGAALAGCEGDFGRKPDPIDGGAAIDGSPATDGAAVTDSGGMATDADAADASVAATDGAVALRILTWDTTRAPTLSFSAGSELQTLRTELAKDFAITWVAVADLGAITPATADGILVSSGASTNVYTTVLSAAEKTALRAFVAGGRFAVIITDNDTAGGAGTDAVNDSYVGTFGFDSTGTLNGPNYVATVTATTHPVVAGVVTYAQHWPGWYVLPDASAVVTIARNQGGVALAELPADALGAGSGRMVFFSDINGMINATPADATNLRLVRQALHYVSGR